MNYDRLSSTKQVSNNVFKYNFEVLVVYLSQMKLDPLDLFDNISNSYI